MCGIAGLFDISGRRSFAREALDAMSESQRHRGPDDAGLHIEPGLGLAFRRLSIIDLATGHQPMFNEDGSVAVVFNGEIYNYEALVPELKALGHTFRTRSDTEVIVHAWEAWGSACLQRFRGMFAFALWDRKRQTLFLARDRLGVKPLYYGFLRDGVLAFGSELKALTSNPEFRRELDPLAIEEYFALGYVADPRTIYRAARKLPPGHSLTIRRGEPVPEPHQYWDVRFTLDNPIGWHDAMEELRQRLDEAVRMRLVSEVPLGAFLSGGVDSSAVVASMAQAMSGPVRTCAIGFEDPAFDESDFARMVADRYATDHRVEQVHSDDFDLVDTLAWCYDEPFADSSSIPTYRVCQLARKHVTVALSGDGGDETFGGYRRYRLHAIEERARRVLPIGLRRPFFRALGGAYPKADWAPRVLRAKTTLQALAGDSVEAYCTSVGLLRDEERERLYSTELKRDLAGYRAVEVFRGHAQRCGTDDPMALVQYLDYKTWLPGDINTKVDRASMAHSLEVREPLMDHSLVEWMATLPTRMKVSNHQGKRIFKKALEPRLPHAVLYRTKMGFSVPLARWLRGPLREHTLRAVLGPRVAGTGYFNPVALRRLVEEHTEGRRDWSAALWTLVMFDAFLRRMEFGSSPVPAQLIR